MKKLNLITGLLLAMLTPLAGAAPVCVPATTPNCLGGLELAAFADNVTASSGVFFNWNSADTSPTEVIDFEQLKKDLIDEDPATYVLSMTPGAFVNLEFTGTSTVYNGPGDDLALFFVGDRNNRFKLKINGQDKEYTPMGTPDPTKVSDRFGEYNLTVAMVELDDFGLVGSTDALGELQVLMNVLNTDLTLTRPSLSLVGGFHTEPYVTNIPLPLPALLFASGLGLLGAFGRKKH